MEESRGIAPMSVPTLKIGEKIMDQVTTDSFTANNGISLITGQESRFRPHKKHFYSPI